MKKNLIIALALAVSTLGSAYAADKAKVTTKQDAPATQTTVKDPSLASSQQPSLQEALAPATETVPFPDAAKPARNAKGVLVDVNVGTLGVGMTVGYEINRYLKVRLRGTYLGADYKDTWNEDSWNTAPIDGKFELDGSAVGLMLDYHPFAGRFHLTGGLNFTGLKVDATAKMDCSDYAQYNGEYEFGGYTYKVAVNDEAKVKGRYEWRKVQPYLGLGWSSDGEGDREVYFTFDMGVNFIGKGKLSVSHEGGTIQLKRPGDADFQVVDDIDSYLETSLREEGKDFFDIADKIIVYPVIQFGIGGRF